MAVEGHVLTVFVAPRRFRRLLFSAVPLAVAMLGGCKVFSVDEDRAIRARRGSDFDAARYVDAIWARKVMPELDRKAVSARDLVAAVDGGIDQAGAKLGRRVGEGSAWTFVVRGEGVVSRVDASSRRGTAEIALADVPGRTARVQIGPVVSGSAVRDSLPFVAFNDFADQLAFADLGRALTTSALAGVKPAIAALRVGQRVRFLGVTNLRAAGDPIVLTPVALTPVKAG